MATCDLSFVVPSDLSLWIFIWTEAKLDFSLPMPAPIQDGAPLNPKKLETASQIVLLNPLAFFIGAGAGGFCKDQSIFFSSLSLQHTSFNEPFDNSLHSTGGGHDLCDSAVTRTLTVGMD